MTDFTNAYNKYAELTESFFENKNLESIKKQSQYFTPSNEVDKMIDDLIICEKDVIRILDPSCGHGILILKLLELLLKNSSIQRLIIYAYDTDKKVLENFKLIFNEIEFVNSNISVEINYLNCDFLESNIEILFDYIIMNPPYKKMNSFKVPEELKHFLKGQPNAYHLFIAKALNYLDLSGTLCIISPKNYLSGRYTEYLRRYIIEKFSIYKIHTFNDRRLVFSHKITQEICITHIRNGKHENIGISYNGNDKLVIPTNKLKVNNNTNIFLTPRNLNDYKLIEQFKKYPLGVIGSSILMKTGKVVQFRVSNKDDVLMSKKYSEYNAGIPLIVYRHIKDEIFCYGELTSKKRNKSITLIDDGTNNVVLVKNKNYLLVRKNTDKKNEKLIHVVPYLKNLVSEKIAIDNGLAYFTNSDDSLTKQQIVGLQCILMSKQFDDYYRMFNSSHTLNIYEFKNMHFPDMNTIQRLGEKLINKELTIDIATEAFRFYLDQ